MKVLKIQQIDKNLDHQKLKKQVMKLKMEVF